MELQQREMDALEEYLQVMDPLIGDQRTRRTLHGVVQGIIASESLVCARIARFSPELARSRHGEKRVRRMVLGETTLRSYLNAESIVERMQQRAVEHLRGESELWVMLERFGPAEAACAADGRADEGQAAGWQGVGEWVPHPERGGRGEGASGGGVSSVVQQSGGGV